MELRDADLKISAPWKGRHFQKDFFYRLVMSKGDKNMSFNDIELQRIKNEIGGLCLK
jgi:hypothetical protein